MTIAARRVVLASGFAAAIALSPMVATFAVPGPHVATPLAACRPDQREDPYTFACVPNGGDNVIGAPSESELTQCSGRDQGQCLEGDLYGPAPVEQPDTSVHQSP